MVIIPPTSAMYKWTTSLRLRVSHNSAYQIHRSIIPVTLAHEPYASITPWRPFIPPAPELGPNDARRWSDVMSLKSSATTIVDVRSPAEYNEDHIPGAINLPVLDNEQRMKIGRLHSEGNILKARMEGAALVCTNISRLLVNLSSRFFPAALNEVSVNGNTPLDELRSNPSLLIYCWRGGQRSKSLATVMSEVGWPAPIHTLVGGYRSWRRLVLRQLDAWPRWKMPGQFWVISGLTGSGKSMLLQELANSDEVVLDLERLARHKGSIFGASFDDQPSESSTDAISVKKMSQRQFETELHRSLTTEPRLLDASQIIWIECESRAIGPDCHLGDSLWTRLRATDSIRGAHRVWLDVPEQARIDWIIKSYANFIRDDASHESALTILSRYHSKRRIDEWRSYAKRCDYTSLVQGLLRHHYDPLYRKSRDPVMSEAAKNNLLHRLHVPVVDINTMRNSIVPQLLDMAYGTRKTSKRNSTA